MRSSSLFSSRRAHRNSDARIAGPAGITRDAPVEVRTGVNLGEVLEDRGEIFGDGVNLAARRVPNHTPAMIRAHEAFGELPDPTSIG